MKRITTTICCIALMILGVSLAFQNFQMPGNRTAMAQAPPLQWNVTGKLPLDLQLDLDKRLSHEPSVEIRDSVVLRDSIVVKTRWKTRYKTVAARTAAREEGLHPLAVNPDSMVNAPPTASTPNREEKIGETVGTPKVPSITLTVDGQVVYNSENENHSTGEGR